MMIRSHRYMKLPDLQTLGGRFLLLMILLGHDAAAQPEVDLQEPGLPPSFIDIPLRLSLEPLIDAADKLLPYQAGNWRTWKDWHGIPSQYRG